MTLCKIIIDSSVKYVRNNIISCSEQTAVDSNERKRKVSNNKLSQNTKNSMKT